MKNIRKDIAEQKALILQYINNNFTKAEIARRLNCNIKTLNKYIDAFGIKYKGNQGGANVKHYISSRYIPYEQYIKINKINTNRLRKKLFREGIKEQRCECCGLTIWNNKPISLEVHHIDGNRLNNELENLQILCPNCHSQTPTYRGKNAYKY